MADIQSPELDKAEIARSILSMQTPDEMRTALDGHDDLKEELAKDPDAFIKKYSANTESEPVKAGEDGKQDVDVDEIVELKLPKKFLGTYKDGEALFNGMKHKDEVITTLREQLAQAQGVSSENIRLKQLLEDHKNKSNIIQHPTNPQPKTVSVDTDFGDLLEEGNQKKLADAIKALSETNQSLKEELEQVKGNVNKVAGSFEEEARKKAAEAVRAAEDTEFASLKSSYSGMFKSNRPIPEIESEYINFLRDGSQLLGYDGSVQSNGQYTEGAKKAYELYHDEKNGAEFRAKLEAANIVFPKDIEDIKTFNSISVIRDKYNGMPLKDAVALYAHQNGYSERQALEQRKKGAEQYAKAVDNRKQYATDIRPSDGAPSQQGIDEHYLKSLIKAYSDARNSGRDSTNERELLKTTLLNSGAMSAEETEYYLNSFSKKE